MISARNPFVLYSSGETRTSLPETMVSFIQIFPAFGRKLVAQEETNNGHQCQSNFLTDRQHQFRSFLPLATAEKGRDLSFQPQPTHIQKVVHSTPFDLLKSMRNKEAHSRNEGTPSFQRRHKMFNKTKLLQRASTRPGLTNSLPSDPSFTTSDCHFSFSYHMSTFAVTARSR